MRYLFVVPPLAGHVNPAAGVAAELAARGERVAWAGVSGIRELIGTGAELFVCETPEGMQDGMRSPDVRGPAALRFLWESFLLPLAESMVPGVLAAIDIFQPDVVVVDQHAFAGGLAATARGVTWATASSTSAELVDPLANLPKVGQWVHDRLRDLRENVGLADLDLDPRFSPDLVLGFSTEELAGKPDTPLADVVRFVGPAVGGDAPALDAAAFPTAWLASAYPTVLITLGTLNADAGGSFLRECVAALTERPTVRAVIVDPLGTLDFPPHNVLVRPWVPQPALLPYVQAVVCHAGHNTVCESLYHGLPLVVAPIRDDQPVIASQVVDTGAGVRLRFGRVQAEQIGTAIDQVLHESRFREQAKRIQKSFRSAGGAAAAADHLIDLARSHGAERSRVSHPLPLPHSGGDGAETPAL
jgi:UDP:flavonoid glycosyltransferase YjiC (YdhE family)